MWTEIFAERESRHHEKSEFDVREFCRYFMTFIIVVFLSPVIRIN